jgi:DNA-3-methyladenine glycosylase II
MAKGLSPMPNVKRANGAVPAACVPSYWQDAKDELMKRDRIMRKVIPQFGDLHLVGRDEPFVTLARSIIGQQISVNAAESVWQRLLAVCPKCTPAQILKAGNGNLALCGLSKRKSEYIVDLAEHFKAKRVHVDKWAEMDDEDVIGELTQIRGIGRWTAEMFLIFNLLRPNILPLDDAGLLKGISVNYFSGEPVSRSDAREVAANWEPWRTVATWYLWRSLDAAAVPVPY